MVWEQVYCMRWKIASPESRAFTAYIRDNTASHGAVCYLLDRIGHLFKSRPPPPSDIMQPRDQRLHWLPIAVDDTSRHEASYVHCTLRGTANPNQLSSRWLLFGSEKWETLYVAPQEIDFDGRFRKAANVSFKDTGGNDRRSLFFSFPVCSCKTAHAHGGRPKLEGRIPRSHGVLRLHAEPCSLSCCLWHNKCNGRGLDRGCYHRFYT